MAESTNIYPPVGFHFRVIVELNPPEPESTKTNKAPNQQNQNQKTNTIGFQSVHGLDVSIQPEIVAEGGQNRFKHQLPTVPQYERIVLKRGLFYDPLLAKWCTDATENFLFEPKNIIISLLNNYHLPLVTWQVFNAYPVKMTVSEFDSEQNSLVIETLEFAYEYFERMDLNDYLKQTLE